MNAHRHTAEDRRGIAAVADPEPGQDAGDRSATPSTGTPATRQALLTISRLLGRHAAIELRSGTSPAAPCIPGEEQ